MDDWLTGARARLAAGVGEDESYYCLTADDVSALLDLARVAAHESGERTNAPLVSYLIGLAHARHPERALRDLIGLATRKDA